MAPLSKKVKIILIALVAIIVVATLIYFSNKSKKEEAARLAKIAKPMSVRDRIKAGIKVEPIKATMKANANLVKADFIDAPTA